MNKWIKIIYHRIENIHAGKTLLMQCAMFFQLVDVRVCFDRQKSVNCARRDFGPGLITHSDLDSRLL